MKLLKIQKNVNYMIKVEKNWLIKLNNNKIKDNKAMEVVLEEVSVVLIFLIFLKIWVEVPEVVMDHIHFHLEVMELDLVDLTVLMVFNNKDEDKIEDNEDNNNNKMIIK